MIAEGRAELPARMQEIRNSCNISVESTISFQTFYKTYASRTSVGFIRLRIGCSIAAPV
jgi:hypothetical protein